MDIKRVSSRISPMKTIRKDNRSVKLNDNERILLDKAKEKYDYSTQKPISWGIKRAVDISHGILGLILTTPVMLVSAAAIKLESKGPVLYKQKRVGKDGKSFTIYKLRTMYDTPQNDNSPVISQDDKRITKVGRFLRKYSIDEFPQFINIIKGDMSLIGPRPILPSEHSKDIPNFVERYAVRPGARLEYGKTSNSTPESRSAADNEYVENWSLRKDFKIFSKIFTDILHGNNY